MDNSGNKLKSPKVKEQSEEYTLIPERYEMINGVRYDFLSSPNVIHQLVVGHMFAAFHFSCRIDGIVLLSPMDVHLDEGDNIAQPDLIYIANENRAIIRDGFVFGVPNLLVEVLSDSTGRKDKSVKREMYERFGVPEYWIVDPVYQTVDQLVLNDEGKYTWMHSFTKGDVLQSHLYPCLTVSLHDVFPE